MSPAEQRYWERMTFRQFAVFFIRLQAFWLFWNALVDASYFAEYLIPADGYPIFTTHSRMILARVGLHVAMAVFCLRYADRILSWFVKDIIPKHPATPAPPTADGTPGSPTTGDAAQSHPGEVRL